MRRIKPFNKVKKQKIKQCFVWANVCVCCHFKKKAIKNIKSGMVMSLEKQVESQDKKAHMYSSNPINGLCAHIYTVFLI